MFNVLEKFFFLLVSCAAGVLFMKLMGFAPVAGISWKWVLSPVWILAAVMYAMGLIALVWAAVPLVKFWVSEALGVMFRRKSRLSDRWQKLFNQK